MHLERNHVPVALPENQNVYHEVLLSLNITQVTAYCKMPIIRGVKFVWNHLARQFACLSFSG